MKKTYAIIFIIILAILSSALTAQTGSNDGTSTEGGGTQAPTPPDAPVSPSLPSVPGTGTAEVQPVPESTDSGTQDSETGENTQAAASNREESAGFLLRATRFIQTPLLVRQGQGSFRDSGEIRDIIITEDGRITHYLADLRNVEGYDSGLYLIEAAGIAVEPENAMLDLTSQPPEMTRVRDEKLIQQYYGNNAMRVTRLLGYEVQGADSRSIGSFSDVVFDPASRTASYIVLVNSGFLGIGSTYHALPFDRITFTPDSELARLDVTVDQLETIRGFDPDYWPVAPDSGRTTGEAAPPAGSQAQETEP